MESSFEELTFKWKRWVSREIQSISERKTRQPAHRGDILARSSFNFYLVSACYVLGFFTSVVPAESLGRQSRHLQFVGVETEFQKHPQGDFLGGPVAKTPSS